jgi:PEP-CTERM motif
MTDQSEVKLQGTRWGLVPLVLFCALVNAPQLKAGPILIFGSWDATHCSNGITLSCGVCPNFFTVSCGSSDHPSDTKTAYIDISCCVSDLGGTVTGAGVYHGFTLGPVRAGLMTVAVPTFIDNENFGQLHESGSIVSLADPSSPVTVYSWSADCTGSGCTPIDTVTFPIELGTSFDVNLADTLTAGPTGPHGGGGAFGSRAQFSFQEAPEPSTLALLGVALMTGTAAYRCRKVGFVGFYKV